MADVTYRIEVVGFNGNGNSSESKDSNKDKPLSLRTLSKGNVIKRASKGQLELTNVLATASVGLARYVVNNAIQTIGIRTGDSYAQQEANFGIGLLSNIGGSAIAGLTMTGGNPVGALVGVLLGGVKTGSDYLATEYRANIRRYWDENYSQEKQKIYDYASYGANRTGGVLY